MFSVPYSTCAICADKLYYDRHCAQSHPDICHSCAELNWSGTTLDNPRHPTPQAPPVLSPRAQRAVAAYVQHVLAATGTGPLADLLVMEEEADDDGL